MRHFDNTERVDEHEWLGIFADNFTFDLDQLDVFYFNLYKVMSGTVDEVQDASADS